MYLSAYGRSLELTDAVLSLIRSHAPVAIGVTGGKDSCAVTFATAQVLDQLGHRGPRILIHSDLGEIEWEESLPVCKRLAEAVGMELLVVRRRAGGLVARWEKRWTDNVGRYSELECVKLILPWSTAALRFCTSELKSAVICAALTARFRGSPILSVSGIRRDESRDRARAPIAAVQNRLVKPRFGTWGLDWHPIGGWTKQDVFSRADLSAAASVAGNHAVYRRLVALEIASTFPFRQDQWLGDIAQHLLDDDTRQTLAASKRAAAERVAAESLIPDHLLYIKGWPHFVPSLQEAELLADVRRRVAASVGITVRFTTGTAVRQRYSELLSARTHPAPHIPIAVQGDLLSSLPIAA